MNLHPDPSNKAKRPPTPLYRRRGFVVACVVGGILLLLLIYPPTRRSFGFAWWRFMARVAPKDIDEAGAAARLQGFLKPGEELPLENGRIEIDKSDRKLHLYNGDRLLRSYPIALGGSPTGHKERKGDQRTPVGEYYICTRRTVTPYHLFMGISYPSALDARHALKRELVDAETVRRVVHAVEGGECPPWDTALGGAIGIHGSGALRGDWTLGCIAMENLDVEDIWVATRKGTPVTIRE